MRFDAYITNIQAKTGKAPEDFRALAQEKGLLRPDLKAAELVAWLKSDFGIGHGHAMAVWAMFVRNGWAQSPKVPR
jgi:hypothetical protein